MNYIVIDPGSHSTGICLIENQKITKSWTLSSHSKSIAVRCREIANQAHALPLPEIHGIFVEVLNVNTSYRTGWSLGAIFAGIGKKCTEKTQVVDKTAKSEKIIPRKRMPDKIIKSSVLVPSVWQSHFNVESYGSNDSDKDAKILRAFKLTGLPFSVNSADEAVAIFMATLLIERGVITK